MEATVVIPTRDRPEKLARALERLAAQATARPFEVVVARDAADEAGTAAIEQRAWPFELRVLQAAVPGASAARNAGWRAASAPLVLFIGDDVLAPPGLLAAHLAAHDAHPEREVAVLGRLDWAEHLRVTPFMRWLEGGIQFDYGRIEGHREVGWWHLYSSNVSLARELLALAGGFDEDFPIYYEDLDLGARLARRGLRLLYEPGAHAEHDHAQTLADWDVRIRRVAVAERRFLERHPETRAHFRELFAEALARPRARGLSARLAPLVPASAPLLGARVHASFDLWHRQRLGTAFMEAWDEAAQTDSSGTGSNPSGSAPGGPKNSSGRAGTPAATV